MENINARIWVGFSFGICGVLLTLLIALVVLDHFLTTVWIVGVLEFSFYMLAGVFIQAILVIIIFRSHFE